MYTPKPRKTIRELAEIEEEAFFQVGGTWEMVEGQPCQTESQAFHLGKMMAYNRVMYQLGVPPVCALFDFAALDAAYAEYEDGR